MAVEIYTALAATGAALAAVAATSQRISTTRLKIKRECAYFDWLPDHLNGLKILHISDLHGNNPDKMNLDIWSYLEGLEFHMAVITGDMIVSYLEQSLPHMKSIAALAKRIPVFYVQGNHELDCFYEMRRLMEMSGVTVFDNDKQIWNIRPFGPISIVGLRDFTELEDMGFKGVDHLLEKSSGSFNLVLSHQPQIVYRMERLKLGLILSGHTHGGQVRIPPLPTIYAPGQGLFPKLGDGWIDLGDNKLYISRGIGTTVFPLRIFNMAEVAIIELAKGASNIMRLS
ncbi:MAG: metallophosphoesterase [Clostridiales bacterium]|jgi:predicted MPP superfamily phosphohydrolase|nr:metallophosphoesterase [Clostridiales bacterium]